jgi:hypothetical protein
MRINTVIALVAMMSSTSVQAFAAPLEDSTKVLLEGSWAARCVSGGVNTDFNPDLRIEFQRSGGSLFSSDGIDLEARGRIMKAVRQGRDIVLTAYYSDDKSAKADIKRLRVINNQALELRGSRPNSKPVTLQRCGRPVRRPVEHLGAATVIDLTLSTRGGAYFVEGSDCHTKPRSWLRFDLIGPSSYSAHRWGEMGDEWILISDASEQSGRVVMAGTAEIARENSLQGTQKQRRVLRLWWLDKSHIRVDPWNATFQRCAD